MNRRASFVCMSGVVVCLLSGCSANFSPSNTFQPEQTLIGPIQGQVHGGQQAVTGASVYLFAAGTGGYGTSSKSLITSTGTLPGNVSVDVNGNGYVTTGPGGNFYLSGDYTCTEGQQVYMVAVGGNPGVGSGANPYIVQMAGLGECPSSGSLAGQDPYVTINEVSTVAFAYAMAPFEGADEYHIGTKNTTAGKLAIHNAMANVSKLVNLQYGQAYSNVPGNLNAAAPLAKIYHLANMLAMCVNSAGTLGTSKLNTNNKWVYTLTNCGNLLNDTNLLTEANGNITTTADEAQAIFYIAQNPSTTDTTKLYNIVTGTTAFPDSLTQVPTDWTLPIIYNGAVSVFGSSGTSNTAGPFNIAIDGSGNAWIGDRVNGVVEITLQGTVNTYDQSFAMIKGVAIDPSGNVWAADYQGNKVYIMAPTGTVSSTLSTAGFNGPASIAFNSAGNAYIVNEGGVSVTVYNSTGTSVLNQSSFAALNIQTPDVIAIDASGNAWITSTGTGDVGELTPTYVASSTALNNLGGSYWLGFDSSADMWIGDITNNYLFRGTLNVSKGTYTFGHSGAGSGGVDFPDLSAIDGAGTVWIPNKTAGTSNASMISAWAGGTGGAFATTTGYATSGTGGAVASAIDLSGNVWVANEDGSVSELIGLGAPTASPLTPTNAGTEP